MAMTEKRYPSGEQRLPSATQPIDRAELERRLEEMRAELPEPETAPDMGNVLDDPDEAEETQLSCPECQESVSSEACAFCKGAGVVSVTKWRAWKTAHR
jgi:hypothetical protein